MLACEKARPYGTSVNGELGEKPRKSCSGDVTGGSGAGSGTISGSGKQIAYKVDPLSVCPYLHNDTEIDFPLPPINVPCGLSAPIERRGRGVWKVCQWHGSRLARSVPHPQTTPAYELGAPRREIAPWRTARSFANVK
ncbi:unnamed protein product, partial [Iphiclides podalirius]